MSATIPSVDRLLQEEIWARHRLLRAGWSLFEATGILDRHLDWRLAASLLEHDCPKQLALRIIS